MSNAQTDSLSPITFTFEYTGHGWAHAAVSDGVTTYEMYPSYVPQDPLFSLVAALDTVLAYGGEAGCTWDYEPAADRWTLRRDGDRLRLTVWGLHDGRLPATWRSNRSELRFATNCDLWKFAAKVRTAVSRLEPVDEEHRDPTRMRASPEYRALCTHLDEHKRAQHPPSVKSKRR
jgi:hypothetical protein